MLTSCNDGHTGIYSRTGEFGNHGAVEWQPWSPVSDGALNVVWGAGSSMNSHVTGGTYNITGQRLNAADGLPLPTAIQGTPSTQGSWCSTALSSALATTTTSA